MKKTILTAEQKIAAKQINKDIKNLVKAIRKINTLNEYVSDHPEIKKEFYRIYRADEKFNLMNKESVLIMFRLNQKYRFEALHMFGIYIDFEI